MSMPSNEPNRLHQLPIFTDHVDYTIPGAPPPPPGGDGRATNGAGALDAPTTEEWIDPARKTKLRGNEDSLDWGLVRELRNDASDRLSEALKHMPEDFTSEDEEERGREIVFTLLAEREAEAIADGQRPLDPDRTRLVAQAVINQLFKLGRFQPLIDDPNVENIEVNGYDNVVLQFKDGHLERGPAVAESDRALEEYIAFIGTRSEANERDFSPANPELHMRLDTGDRLAAWSWITPRPCVVIRKHRLKEVTLADLVEMDLCDEVMADFLAAAVRARKSIIVSGPQGAGKTTLLRALCAELNPWERIGTIETEYELHLHELTDRHRRILPMEARPGSGEIGADGRPAGEIDVNRLSYSSLRANLDRVIVGEVRGKEAAAMFKAMRSGAGSMSTTHGKNALRALDQVATCAMEDASNVSSEFAYRNIANYIDVVVQIELDATSTTGEDFHRDRYITEILAVHEGDGFGGLGTTTVWRPGPDRRAEPGTMPDGLARDLMRYGFDLNAYLAQGGGNMGESAAQ